MVINNFFKKKINKTRLQLLAFFDFLVERFKLNCARLIALKTEENICVRKKIILRFIHESGVYLKRDVENVQFLWSCEKCKA